MPRKNHGRRKKKAFDRPRIKPDADNRLKPVFERIGTPPKTPFVADPYQLEAVAAAALSDCLVSAPTGAGKTWIAQQAISRVLSDGGRSWYASPLKALSNAKYIEFGERFGKENVGILTGDRKENPDAPMIVGTTEVLRNQLYDAMHQGTTLACDFVVLDEAHFLGDLERGVVWEEIIIYLPERITMLLLSATIGNHHQIARWISKIRNKTCAVVHETHRHVPLYPLFLHPSGTLMPLVTGISLPGNPRPEGGQPTRIRLDKKILAYAKNRKSMFMAPPNQLPPFGEILRILRKFKLLPAIFFLKSRADCDKALDLCTGMAVSPRRQSELNRRIHELVDLRPHLQKHRQMTYLEHFAVGSHHSGQLPAWKLVLEKLMSQGMLDAIFATSTVAAGVDFPARSIVILNSDRFNGIEFLPLDPTEFHQMAGRAGRRGKDNIGFAIAVPGKYMDIRHIARLTALPPSNVDSQIRINFSMVLNLLLSHSPDQIKDLLQKSFAAFQLEEKKTARAGTAPVAEQYFVADFRRHLDFLKDNGFVESTGALTHDGMWASQLRVDAPLMIAECLRQELFPAEDPALLAAAVCTFVNEDETNESIDPIFMPNKLKKIHRQLTKGLSPLAQRQKAAGFYTRPLYSRPMATLYAWAMGYAWEKVVQLSELEPGNLVMLILRTADNIRHLAGLGDYFPEVSQSARKAVELILKEPVIFDA